MPQPDNGITTLYSELLEQVKGSRKPIAMGVSQEGGRYVNADDIRSFASSLRTSGEDIRFIKYDPKERTCLVLINGLESKPLKFSEIENKLRGYLAGQKFDSKTTTSSPPRSGARVPEVPKPGYVVAAVAGEEDVLLPSSAGVKPKSVYDLVEESNELREQMGARNAPGFSPDTPVPVPLPPQDLELKLLKQPFVNTEEVDTRGFDKVQEVYISESPEERDEIDLAGIADILDEPSPREEDQVPKSELRKVQNALLSSQNIARGLEQQVNAYKGMTPSQVAKQGSQLFVLKSELKGYRELGITPEEIPTLRENSAALAQLRSEKEALVALLPEYNDHLGLAEQVNQALTDRRIKLEEITKIADDLRLKWDASKQKIEELCSSSNNYDELQSKYNELDRKFTEDEEVIAAQTVSIRRYEGEIGELNAQLKTFPQQIEELTKELRDARADARTFKSGKEVLAQTHATLGFGEVTKERDILLQEKEEHQRKYKEVTQRLEIVAQELNADDSLISELNLRIEEYETANKDLKQRIAKHEELLKDYDQKYVALSFKASAMEKNLAQESDVKGYTLDQVIELKTKADRVPELKRKADAYDEKKSRLEDAKNRYRSAGLKRNIALGAAVVLSALALFTSYKLDSNIAYYTSQSSKKEAQIQILTEAQKKQAAENAARVADFQRQVREIETKYTQAQTNFTDTSASFTSCLADNERLERSQEGLGRKLDGAQQLCYEKIGEATKEADIRAAELGRSLESSNAACNQRVTEATVAADEKAAELQGSLDGCVSTQAETRITLEQECRDKLEQSTEELRRKTEEQEKVIKTLRSTSGSPFI